MLRTWLSLLALVGMAALLLACARGEAVDLLVTGGTVVTMDADRRVIENGAVAVRGERIVAVGPAGEVDRRYRARHRLRADGRLVLPGLINAHTHAAMSLYRGVADDLTLEEWLQDYIFPLEAKLTTPESVYWGTKLAALEMIRGGITTFVDMYYFEDTVAEAVANAALLRKESRGSHTRTDFPTRDDGQFLKHSICFRTDDGPRVEYKPVTITRWQPEERKY